MRAFVLLLLIASVSLGSARQGSNLHRWLQHKRQHGGVHANSDLEDFTRALGFTHDVKEHQEQPELAQSDEFLQSILNRSSPVPDQVDWRKDPNVVAPVLNQKHCSSSYAFAAIGVLEGQQVKRGFSKTLQPLSAGQALSCSIHARGCLGGTASIALEDIHRIGGIETAADYEYAYVDVNCQFDETKVLMKTAGKLELPEGESSLKSVVASYGPVAAQIQANDQFYAYKSGVFDDQSCDGTDLNQAVLVVGYGTDPNEGDYWILKNSWGTKWGENGFMRVRRGSSRCGLGKVSTIAKF